MKKRGVRKAKSSSRRRPARKKAKPKAKPNAKRKKRPVSEVAAAGNILAKEEKAIEKGIQFAFGPKSST